MDDDGSAIGSIVLERWNHHEWSPRNNESSSSQSSHDGVAIVDDPMQIDEVGDTTLCFNESLGVFWWWSRARDNRKYKGIGMAMDIERYKKMEFMINKSKN